MTVSGGTNLDGVHDSFCVDSAHRIDFGVDYTAAVYSSYETLPAGTVLYPENLDLVNWLVNQGFVGTASPGGFGTYTYGDVQRAIWVLTGDHLTDFGLGPWDPNRADEIVAAAQAMGEGFEPGCGDLVAVVMVPGGFAQVTIALIELPCEAWKCNGLYGTTVGSSGSDTIVGTSGADVIIGLDGNDTIDGLAGNDVICAGPGNDQVDAGPGDDYVWGGSGIDTLWGRDGNDWLWGGTGRDRLIGNADGDRLWGEEQDDLLKGGLDDDFLFGGPGDDRLLGGAGDDNLFGQGNDDDLRGRSGDDMITGGPGDDDAFGGLGIDTCDAEFTVNCEL
jgi:hypothetical protein